MELQFFLCQNVSKWRNSWGSIMAMVSKDPTFSRPSSPPPRQKPSPCSCVQSRRWRTDKEHPHLPKTSTEDTWRNDWQYLTVIQTKHQRSMLIYLKAWKNRSHKKEWWSLKPVPLLDLCGGLPKNPILHAAWEQMRKPIWPPGPVNWSACATCKIYCNHAPKAINLLGESVRIHHHHRLLVNLMVKGGSCLIQTF